MSQGSCFVLTKFPNFNPNFQSKFEVLWPQKRFLNFSGSSVLVETLCPPWVLNASTNQAH